MKRQFDNVKAKPLIYFSGGVLLVQIFLIIACNLTLLERNIDGDNAKLFVHIMEMWRNRKIVIPDWSYMTTLEIDCSSLLALPFYAITDNIYLSFGIANVICMLFFVVTVFYLFKGKHILYPLFAANLLCIPYAVGMLDYFNMLFFGGAQYIIKVLLPILFIAVLMNSENSKKIWRIIWLGFSGIFIVLLFVTSVSSGIYVFAVGILPIILMYLSYKILNRQKIPVHFMVLCGMSLLVTVAGICLNDRIMGGARGNSMILINIYQVLSNTSSCIAGIFELFGGSTTEMTLPVFSLEGIAMLAKIIFVFVFLACGIVAVQKLLKKQLDFRMTLLLSVFVWNLFVLLVSNVRAGSGTYEYRYHLMGMIPLICVTSKVLLDAFAKGNAIQRKFFGTIGVLALLVVNVLSFRTALNAEDKQADLKELCAYCDPCEFDYVFMYDASNDADMCRLIREGNTLYLCVTTDGKLCVFDYYAAYIDGAMVKENAILAVDDSKYEFGDAFEEFGFKFQKFDTVAGRSLYHIDN